MLFLGFRDLFPLRLVALILCGRRDDLAQTFDGDGCGVYCSLPIFQFQMASSDITVDYGDIVVKVARAGSESSIVAGDGLVIACREKQLICFGFDFVGFF